MGQQGMGGDLAANEVAALRKVIELFNEQASKQTQQMLNLTKAIAILTFVMTVGLIVQIWLAVRH